VLLIASGTQPHGPAVLLGLAPIRFIGKISYSLYLWHWPMLILGGLYLQGSMQPAVAPGALPVMLTPVQAYVLALFSIPVATVSWGLVEEPFRRGYIPLPRPSRTVMAGVAVMVMVALVGTSFSFSAQNALADLGGETAQVNPTDTPQPDVTPGNSATATPVTPAPSFATPSPVIRPRRSRDDPGPDDAPAAPPATSFAVTNALRPTLANAPTDYEAPWGITAWAGKRRRSRPPGQVRLR